VSAVELRDAMAAAGVDLGAEPLIADGNIHRFCGPGDKRDKRNCWYVLFADGGAAAFGSWRLGIEQTWTSGNFDRSERRQEIEEARRRVESERVQARASAAIKARTLYSKKAAAPTLDHPYLSSKKIHPHGIKQLGRTLVIPLSDVETGQIVNLQFIHEDGAKFFLAGGRVAGCYFPITDDLDSSAKRSQLLIAEGFATAASLYEATKIPTAVAFNAGNLRHVAEKLHAKHPNAQITVAGDNDSATPGNPGLTKAWEAAQAVNGLLTIPTFVDLTSGTDFNDLALKQGIEALRSQVANAVPPASQGPLHPEIARLLGLDGLAYEQRREGVARQLGIKPARLDKLVKNSPARATRATSSNIRTGNIQTLGAEGLGDRSNECSDAQTVRTLDELYEAAKDIIESPDILARVEDVVKELGYAGEPTSVILVYVGVTSRLGDKPINVHLNAPSAAGKNFVINTALTLIPEEAVIKMTATSPKALIYSEENLKHKTVVLAECDSLVTLEGNAATLVRSIIEDSRTDYDVVEKAPETGRNITRRVSKEGPTGLITTGVCDLESQTSTRVLNVHLVDTPEQTRQILQAEARIATGQNVAVPAAQIAKFHDFQRWLAAQPCPTVIVPFAGILADKISAGEVRMRRDFKQLLAVIKTVALLNQNNRKRNARGSVIAELADYRWARTLLLPVFRSIVGGGITDAIRKTCEAIPTESEVSEADLVTTLGLSKSTIYYRVNRALRGGWLRNLETRSGYRFRLVRGTPLPEDDSPLPTVQELEKLLGFDQAGNSNGHSNSPQPFGRVEQTEDPFDCSNENEGYEV
jgi:phage/plasmid primase-like uncharacterized protein